MGHNKTYNKFFPKTLSLHQISANLYLLQNTVYLSSFSTDLYKTRYCMYVKVKETWFENIQLGPI